MIVPISACVPGHISEALSTTVLPQASGIAIARTPRITGAFHGAMPSTTPTGWRIAIAKLFGLSDGITSPATCVVIEAASRIRLAAKWLLKWPHGPMAPHSAVISAENSAPLASSRSAALSSIRRRSPGPSADQAGNAAAAASAAAMASPIEAAAARLATSPVNGSMRSKVRPSAANTSRSPIMRLTCFMAFSRRSFCSVVTAGTAEASPIPR